MIRRGNVYSLVLFSIVAVLAFAMSAQAKVTLDMVTHWNTGVSQGALLKQYVEEYNAMQDEVEVVLSSDPSNSQLSKILVWAAGGTLPDILPISQVVIPDLAGTGIIQPLAEGTLDQVENAFLPGAIQLVTYDDQVWGYPTENMPNALSFDTVEFANRGVSTDFPETWPEVVEIAKALTTYNNDGSIQKAGLGWSQGFRENIGFLMSQVWGGGGQLFSSDLRKANLLSEPVRNAVDLLEDIVHESGAVKLGGSRTLEHQAIRITPGPWVRGSILAADESRLQEIHTAPMPVGPSGNRVVANYGWAITIAATTDHPVESQEFLAWLANDVQQDTGTTRMGDIMATLGSIPNTRADIANQPFVQEPFMQGFVAPMAANQVRSWPMVPNSAEVYKVLNRELNAVINGKSSPFQALNNAQTEIQAAIDAAVAGE